jgi:hypothetical protein
MGGCGGARPGEATSERRRQLAGSADRVVGRRAKARRPVGGAALAGRRGRARRPMGGAAWRRWLAGVWRRTWG